MADPTELDQADGGQLRQMLEGAIEENRALKGEVKAHVYDQAGFPLDTPRGKALAQLHDGELSPQAVRDFAAERFGWGQTSSEASQVEAIALARSEGESRLDQVASFAYSDVDTEESRIAKAEADGDWDTFNKLSAEKLRRMRK